MIAIKKILLKNVKEGMFLAKDVIDQNGRMLIISGVKLKQETLNLLEKHDVTNLFVKNSKCLNREIDRIQDVVNNEIRLKLISIVNNTFSSSNGLVEHLVELQNYVENIVYTLIDRKDVLMYLNDIQETNDYLFMHSVNVGLFSIVIGKTMNLPHDELCILGMGGLLHDLGKIRISKELINKQGKLTALEFNEIKEHSAIGYNMLKLDKQLDYRIALVALQHHERCNGSGYPWGIVKHKMHPLARIVAVADVYDALTTDRVYRHKLTSIKAMKIINEGDKSSFDHDVIEAFNKVVVPYPIGSNIKLNNGIEGNVLRLNSTNLDRPLISTQNGIINLLHQSDMNIIAVNY